MEQSARRVISVIVLNEASVLSRIAGLFSGRGYNIESLTVAPIPDSKYSRITIVTAGSIKVVEQIIKQLHKLIPVLKVYEHADLVEKEMAMVKIPLSESLGDVEALAHAYNGHIVNVGSETMIVMVADEPIRVGHFLEAIKRFHPKKLYEAVQSLWSDNMTLSEIVSFLGMNIAIDSDCEIYGLNTLKDAQKGEISFLSDSKYEKDLENTKASAVILPASKAAILPKGVVAIASEEAYLDLAKLSKLFSKPPVTSNTTPIIGEGSQIYPTAHVENGAKIGSNSIIMAGAYIGGDVVIGDNVIIYPNATIYRDCVLGNHVMIHAGSVIGSDGFGYAHTKMGEHIKLYQNGNVIIEDDVEIGANTTIDCAVFGSTIIKKGTKIDNLVQIGHNCVVGEYSIMVSQSGLAGSTTLGRNVVMGGQSAAAGHLTIAPFTTLAARSGVTKSITNGGVYSGFPLMEHKLWLKLQAKLAKILQS